jgi:hypothetical protein
MASEDMHHLWGSSQAGAACDSVPGTEALAPIFYHAVGDISCVEKAAQAWH